jgi:hypothetical protein
VWIHGRRSCDPAVPVCRLAWRAIRAVSGDTLRLYPLVIILLIIGAIYEAIEIVYVVPLFV